MVVGIGADKRITVIHERMKSSREDTPDEGPVSRGQAPNYP